MKQNVIAVLNPT